MARVQKQAHGHQQLDAFLIVADTLGVADPAQIEIGVEERYKQKVEAEAPGRPGLDARHPTPAPIAEEQPGGDERHMQVVLNRRQVVD